MHIGKFAATVGALAIGQLAANSPGVCFIAGTLVLSDDGEVAIEEIQVGDYVLAKDPESGEEGFREVLTAYVKETDELIHLTVDGETITTTRSHPFYEARKGWTEACKLRAGDILVTVNGRYAVLEQVSHEILESPVLVYNLEVDEYHTYFVSAIGVLVHNECTKANSKKYSENHLSQKLGITVEQFHREVKPALKSYIPHNIDLGKNPDIMLNAKGEFGFQSRLNNRLFYGTSINILDVLKKKGLR